MNERDRFTKGFNAEELLATILLASMFLTVVGLEFNIIGDKKFSFVIVCNGKILLQYKMKNKDNLILEDIYKQYDSDYYILFEKCHIDLHYHYR